MNIIVLHNNFQDTAFPIEEMVCYTIPETAVQKNGKPVFLPDYANPALLEAHLALRISRLGRHISERFAHRYYDAITVMPHFVAPALFEVARAKGLPWSMATGFDTALPVGEFVSLDGLDPSALDFHLTVDGERIIAGSVADMRWSFDQAIAHVSQCYTLRRGDWLLMGSPAAPVEIAPDHHVEAFLHQQRVAAFNVK